MMVNDMFRVTVWMFVISYTITKIPACCILLLLVLFMLALKRVRIYLMYNLELFLKILRSHWALDKLCTHVS